METFRPLRERETKPGPKPLKSLGRETKKKLGADLAAERRIVDIGARFVLFW
jgi:hypothetical protein